MKTLAITLKEEFKLIDPEKIKAMAEESDCAQLAFHTAGTENIEFCEADDIIEKLAEYIQIAGHDTPEETETSFWQNAYITTKENYIRATLADMQSLDGIDCISNTIAGYALLLDEEAEPYANLLIETKIKTKLPGAAEKTLFHWKNGWDHVESYGPTEAGSIDGAISGDFFSDDDHYGNIDLLYQEITFLKKEKIDSDETSAEEKAEAMKLVEALEKEIGESCPGDHYLISGSRIIKKTTSLTQGIEYDLNFYRLGYYIND